MNYVIFILMVILSILIPFNAQAKHLNIHVQCDANAPATQCFEKISDIYKYRINCQQCGAYKILHAKKYSGEIHQAITEILNDLDVYSFAIEDKAGDESVIKIYGEMPSENTPTAINKNQGNFSDRNITSNQEKTPAISPKEETNNTAIDPLDMPAFYSSDSEGKGMTYRELKAIQDKYQFERAGRDPLDEEVLPPLKPGGKGTTLRQLQSGQIQ